MLDNHPKRYNSAFGDRLKSTDHFHPEQFKAIQRGQDSLIEFSSLISGKRTGGRPGFLRVDSNRVLRRFVQSIHVPNGNSLFEQMFECPRDPFRTRARWLDRSKSGSGIAMARFASVTSTDPYSLGGNFPSKKRSTRSGLALHGRCSLGENSRFDRALFSIDVIERKRSNNQICKKLQLSSSRDSG